MDKISGVYNSVKNFIDAAILSIAQSVPNIDIKTEVVYESDEWKGIRILRTPSTRARRKFIDGRKEAEFNIQLGSRQIIEEEKLIRYSAYLDELGDIIEQAFKEQKPEAVEGVEFRAVEISGASTLIFTDGKISMYAIDVKFIFVV